MEIEVTRAAVGSRRFADSQCQDQRDRFKSPIPTPTPTNTNTTNAAASRILEIPHFWASALSLLCLGAEGRSPVADSDFTRGFV